MKPEPEVVNQQPINLEGLVLENPAMLMTPKSFAVHVRLSTGVVGAWIDNGYLPTVKIGKRRLVNLLKLKEMLLHTQPDFSGFKGVDS